MSLSPLPLPPKSCSILVVEDEALVRRVVSRRLRRYGYQVLEAADGREALSLGRAWSQRLDLLLTDVILPEMNARAVVDGVRALHPEAAVLYMSGYPADVIAYRGFVDPGIAFLEKTQLPTHLIDRVQQLLRPHA